MVNVSMPSGGRGSTFGHFLRQFLLSSPLAETQYCTSLGGKILLLKELVRGGRILTSMVMEARQGRFDDDVVEFSPMYVTTARACETSLNS